MITVVTCITNPTHYMWWLGKSLMEEQDEFKLIKAPIELSLHDAYNWAIDRVDTKYIAFIHADVGLLEDGRWFSKVEKICDSLPNLGVAGVIGRGFNGEHYGAMYARVDNPRMKCIFKGRKYVGAQVYGEITESKIAQTVDHMIMIVPTEVAKRQKFDPQFTDHCGAEDFCLAIAKLGLKVYVIPCGAWHKPYWKRRYYPDGKPIIGQGKIAGELTYSTNLWYSNIKLQDAIRRLLKKWQGINIYSTNFVYKDGKLMP